MYIPPYFKIQSQSAILDFIRQNSFGMLISPLVPMPEVTHIPFIVSELAGPGKPEPTNQDLRSFQPAQSTEKAKGIGKPSETDGTDEKQIQLLFHVAAANPNPQPGPAMAIFQGPHAYISPSWYEESNAVPTWNYIAIHVRGELERINDHDMMQRLMDSTVSEFEQGSSPWSIDWSNTYMNRMLEGVRCFRMDVQSLQGKAKLSQNHSVQRQKKVIARLESGSEMDREIARLMKAELEKKNESMD